MFTSTTLAWLVGGTRLVVSIHGMTVGPSEVAIITIINEPILLHDLVSKLLVEIDVCLVAHGKLILDHQLFALLSRYGLVGVEEVHQQLVKVWFVISDHLQFVLAHVLSELVERVATTGVGIDLIFLICTLIDQKVEVEVTGRQ